MSKGYDTELEGHPLGIPEDIWEDAKYIAWIEDEREVEYIDNINDGIELEQSLEDQD